MRDYGKVHTSFWTSGSMRELSDDARMMALYLITSPHSTIAGVFRLPDGYVCDDLQWSSTRVAKGFDELLRKGFATRCKHTKWVWVTHHFEWNPPENPNQRKSAAKIALSVPEQCDWKLAFMRANGRFLGLYVPDDPNPSATLPQPFLNQEQEQEQEQEHTPTPRKRGDGVHGFPPGFDEFWSAYPRKIAKPAAAKAFARIRPDAATLACMLAAIAVQRASPQWTKDRGEFIPHPATWINGHRWEDTDDAAAAQPDRFAGAL